MTVHVAPKFSSEKWNVNEIFKILKDKGFNASAMTVQSGRQTAVPEFFNWHSVKLLFRILFVNIPDLKTNKLLKSGFVPER